MDVGDEFLIMNLLHLGSTRTGFFRDPASLHLLPEGGEFMDRYGVTWLISYQGGDGNDVVLTIRSLAQGEIPEPASLILFGAGLAALARRRKRARHLAG